MVETGKETENALSCGFGEQDTAIESGNLAFGVKHDVL